MISPPTQLTLLRADNILQSLFHVECLSVACSVAAWYAADVTVRNGSRWLLRTGERATRERAWLVPGFCENTRSRHGRGGQRRCRGVPGKSRRAGQGPAGRIMRQRRSVAAAMDYIRALSRETRANCWELALRAGHEGRCHGRTCRSRREAGIAHTRQVKSLQAAVVLRKSPYPHSVIIAGTSWVPSGENFTKGAGRYRACPRRTPLSAHKAEKRGLSRPYQVRRRSPDPVRHLWHLLSRLLLALPFRDRT